MKLTSTTQPDNSVRIVLTLGQHNALLATIDTCSEAAYALQPGIKEDSPDSPDAVLASLLGDAFAALRQINDAINAADVPCISAVAPKPKTEAPADG